jgi:GTPase SAR1 family protein
MCNILIVSFLALILLEQNNLVRTPLAFKPSWFISTLALFANTRCSFLVAMRDLYMKTGQGFLLVFSITSSSSLSELAGLREEIIRIKDDENVPIVIVGNKADLEEQRAVPRARAFAISQRWGAPYYEASARTRSKFLTLSP